jgi:hypothetical protein
MNGSFGRASVGDLSSPTTAEAVEKSFVDAKAQHLSHER